MDVEDFSRNLKMKSTAEMKPTDTLHKPKNTTDSNHFNIEQLH